MRTLVVRTSGSSLYYRLVQRGRAGPLAAGTVRDIGGDAEHVYGYTAGRGEGATDAATLDEAVDRVSELLSELENEGVGVGVGLVTYLVPGGDAGAGPVVTVDDAFMERRASAAGANPAERDAVRLMRAWRVRYPDRRHVAVMGDAFFSDLPQESSAYLLPESVVGTLGLRRRGHRGLLHSAAVVRVTQELLLAEGRESGRFRMGQSGPPPEKPRRRVVLCFLDRLAGVTAVLSGRPAWTTFGVSPGDGLPGESGLGSIDVGVLEACLALPGMSPDKLLAMLRNGAGLGLSPAGDPAAVDGLALGAERDVEPARRVWGAFVLSVVAAIGAATTVLGGIDALAFVGSGALASHRFRRAVCSGLALMGIRPPETTAVSQTEVTVLSPEGARPLVLAVPVDEDDLAARAALDAVAG